jgi:hypothetical protein
MVLREDKPATDVAKNSPERAHNSHSTNAAAGLMRSLLDHVALASFLETIADTIAALAALRYRRGPCLRYVQVRRLPTLSRLAHKNGGGTMRIGGCIFNQNYTDWDRYEAEEQGKSVPPRARRSDREIFNEELGIARIADETGFDGD